MTACLEIFIVWKQVEFIMDYICTGSQWPKNQPPPGGNILSVKDKVVKYVLLMNGISVSATFLLTYNKSICKEFKKKSFEFSD